MTIFQVPVHDASWPIEAASKTASIRRRPHSWVSCPSYGKFNARLLNLGIVTL